MIYLDSNVFIIASNRDDERWDQALELLERMEKGEIQCCTSVITVDEVVWGVSNLVGKEEAKEVWESILEEQNLQLISLEELDVSSAKEHFPGLDPRDCLHLQTFKKSKSNFLVTEDEDFHDLEGIKSLTISEFLEKF